MHTCLHVFFPDMLSISGMGRTRSAERTEVQPRTSQFDWTDFQRVGEGDSLK
jgi:hypothetical protein